MIVIHMYDTYYYYYYYYIYICTEYINIYIYDSDTYV